jgi:hypothetical protein
MSRSSHPGEMNDSLPEMDAPWYKNTNIEILNPKQYRISKYKTDRNEFEI